MRRVAQLSEKDRKDLFRDTAQQMKVHEAIIEKDFWVCWILDYLFQDSPWKDKLIFKGGTSLSKAYGVIQRFSEDVDLILDWSLLGLTEAEAFKDHPSRAKQDAFGDSVRTQTIEFLNQEFVPRIQTDLQVRLGADLKVRQDEIVIQFEYPKSFSDGYIREEILLDVSPKALKEPNEPRDIISYAAEVNGKYFETATVSVRTINAERTFWEKATILHQIANWPTNKPLIHRYSRHYYDLFQLSKTQVLDKAIEEIELLETVRQFKQKFFSSAWAKYEDAIPGRLKLIPRDNLIEGLKKDYASMQSMIFGTAPGFDEILVGLSELEKQINGLVNNKK